MVYVVLIFDLISIENAFKWLLKSVIYFSKKDTFRFRKWNILILRLYFTVFTPWGGEIDSITNRLIEIKYLKEPINFTHFIKNYYGYIKVK